MINKKSIWFLTLFSLILVLSVYYITMPSELLFNTNSNYNEETKTTNTETTSKEETTLVSLRIKAEEELLADMNNLQLVLTNEKSTIEDKNKAYDKMKDLNIKRGEEEKLEAKIKEKLQLDSFVKIKDDKIEVVINKKEHDNTLANNVMRLIQENYQNKMYISVKFTN